MPAKGKHRRPKAQRLTRSIAAAGTGGAALALPFMAASGAHAATPESAPQGVSRAVAQTVSQKAAPTAPVTRKSAATTYTVRSGDYLSKIAAEQHVGGGWEKLYQDNREAVGADPSLIHPGLKLSIGAKAASGAPKSSGSSSSSSSAHSFAKSSRSATTSKSPEASKSSSSGSSAKAAAQAAESSASGFTLPVSGATVGTPYHQSGSMWSSGYHTGVDFVVPTGTSLKAVAAGTVVSAGWGGAYGNQVVIKLNDGYYAQYAHLSQLSVSAGQTVGAGQQVGLSGATGNVTGPHLHFEIRTTPDYGSDVDPVAYLRAHGVSVG
ncbi:LysM peptidoglycan-binding domain-containing M23 family metallopeptidase [Streptomyces sp. ID05-04B]|uniref:M23 family metallopeptidase n=1 Tax=Streptomyces sp. ID05-04B TaxID=3028661 RepID=UPI0029C2694D|nr:LysM peptidoglycan-binding domain-containing M23 family metallopeptidase [Streptomyces sp. ID05-04B]MDX5566388.1 LysM peptidoglycan-binding domain-containing M23 family metallopeptidase [Streptomyces sp. ID05-04B]